MVLSALSRAIADPEGLPLHGGKTTPGLFPATAAGKQAAQRCLEEGFLQSPNTNDRRARCIITEKGMSYLFDEVSPRQVLEDFVRVVESRQAQIDGLVAATRELQNGLDALRANAERVLSQVVRSSSQGAGLNGMFRSFQNGSAHSPAPSESSLTDVVMAYLAAWKGSEDCPLPELFRQAASGQSIGRFHDLLRQLHDAGKIYLHPWTGPLYDLPEPPLALLIGHEIAYYASIRN
jgi:hypothetical protein